ncbi:GYF domain-containing protein gyf-1 [Caenorhabditis elegans]|uniref:Isoform c of GYF domain-containing protein gyf-1 n=1 Tax=Caenorhabditis elegans TaxID=6239 RepID=Q09237-4|nr:GYF domain-containing protein gyf-1 [Caenorhabditis elegans]SOF58736.1 GYF domain-containing protein gyf-1 [Caenorhabditis elegans]|eukprot:NP_001343745.1 GYF domain-containing protein C18H9.3 [Caenorhabditis elegans]
MSSVSSAEPTAQQNFNPSWMRPNAANRGGSISSGNNRSSGFGGGGFDDGGDEISSSAIAAAAAAVLSSPVVSEFSYTRERLLELAPTGSIMPDALRDQLFFNEKNLPLVSNTPLSEHEQKLQHNINSSKAMSLLSHADRASIAAGAAYGSGYGAASGALQNGQSPTSRWAPKSSWNKGTPDRGTGTTPRGGGSVGRASGAFFAGRGGGRIGGENGFGGATNGGSPAAQNEDSPGTYQSKFNALRRGGGAGSVGRGGSTTGSAFNTRADALYNPNDPTDRPKAVNPAATRSESDEEEEEGWSKVGSTSRTSTNAAPQSSERPAWARSESWIQRTQQQQQQQQQQSTQQQAQPPITLWNNREVGSDSTVWKDRNHMVAAVRKASTENHPPQQQQQQQQRSSAPVSAPSRQESESTDVPNLPIPTYPSDPSAWSNNSMGGGIFYQPTPQPPAPIVKEEPVQFYYMDPTETRRGPFPKDQMNVWFKAGYFTDESLRVQRGENGEYKTIGDLKKLHGSSTPFEYLEDIEPPRPILPSIPYPSATNPLYPAAFGGVNMWSSMGQPTDVYMMQTNFEQQLVAERNRLLDDHNRRLAEEAEKMAKFQEAMYRQLTMQHEQRVREQELLLQKRAEEIEKREAESKREEAARLQKLEQEAREIEERKAALEAEDRRKREIEEYNRMCEKKKNEIIAKEAADRMRLEEATERERRRLEAESRVAEEKIRRDRVRAELEAREREEERKRAAERERIARETASLQQQAELDAAWAGKKIATVTTSNSAFTGAPKQVSPSGSEESDEWISTSKEVKHTKTAPWAAKVEAPQKSEKTLLEIQKEEERKFKVEQEKNAKLKAKEQASNITSAAAIAGDKSGGLWGASKTWAAPESNSSKSYVSPFLDGPSLEAANKMALQKKNSQPKIAVPAKSAPTSAKVATPVKAKATAVAVSSPATNQKTKKTKEQVATDELQQWFVKRFQQFSTQVDSSTLFDCIMSLENPNEVEDIVMSYLDESKTVKEFVREFIKRRIAMRAAGGRPDADDLTSARTAAAAPSDSNSGSNSNSGNGQGKKKKKTQKQVLDGNILGFRGTAAADRLNKGEIDAVPSAPVNPSRR